MLKRNIIAGNWKMNKTPKETKEFIEKLLPLIKGANSKVFLAPSFVCLPIALQAANNTNLVIGAQNMHNEDSGAFTGEVSVSMLKDLGAKFVILGHSERRQVFKESDDFINKKVLKALNHGITPILCIGETQEQRDNSETQSVLKTQLEKGLKDVTKDLIKDVIIAYEPVWAIGTGKTATNEIAQGTHQFIRKILAQKFKQIVDDISILYGGSVKPDNLESLLKQNDINGALVGGASLKFDSFAQLVNKS